MTLTKQMLGEYADKLGNIKAVLADLTRQEAEIKKVLAESGYAVIEGQLFKATVCMFEKTTLNTDAVKQFLTLDQIRICSQTSVVTQVRCSARTKMEMRNV